jgi:hypothetical protein
MTLRLPLTFFAHAPLYTLGEFLYSFQAAGGLKAMVPQPTTKRPEPTRHPALLILVVGVASLLLKRSAMLFEQLFGSPRWWHHPHPVGKVPLLIPELEYGIGDPPKSPGGQYHRGTVVPHEQILGEAAVELPTGPFTGYSISSLVVISLFLMTIATIATQKKMLTDTTPQGSRQKWLTNG